MSIKAPNRHAGLLKEAATLALQILDDESPEPVQELVRRLSDFNERECHPPKPDAHIEEIAKTVMAHILNAVGEA